MRNFLWKIRKELGGILVSLKFPSPHITYFVFKLISVPKDY